MPVTLRLPAALILSIAICAMSGPARAQKVPAILIISQPHAGIARELNVDVAPFLSRELSDSGKFEPVTFKSSLPGLRDALAAHSIVDADLSEPIGKEASRKLARALGATFVLRVSAELTPKGVGGDVEMERITGQQAWSPMLVSKFEPYSSRGKKVSILEGINAIVAGVMQKLTGAVNTVAVGEPVRVKVPGNPKRGPKTARGAKTDKKGNDAVAGRGAPTVAGSTSPTEAATPASGNKAATPGPAAAAGAGAGGQALRSQQPAVDPQPGAGVVKPDVKKDLSPTLSPLDFRVREFRRKGDLPNLIISLRRLVNERPRDVRLRGDLAKAYIERGWQSAARDEALRAVTLAPGEAPAHRLLGDCYVGSGQGEAALIEYQEAVRLDPKSADNYVALGDGYWAAARPDEALQAYSSAVKTDGKSAAGHRRLAKVYALKGQYAECAAEMTTAKGLTAPDDPAAMADYGDLLRSAEAGLNDILNQKKMVRAALLNTTKTRELAFKDVSALKRRAEDLASFLDTMPPPPTLIRVQNVFSQAADLVVQSTEATLQFFETQDTRRDDEATLLQVEVARLLGDAGKKLKAATTPRPSE